jgi:hypothetical protein
VLPRPKRVGIKVRVDMQSLKNVLTAHNGRRKAKKIPMGIELIKP